MIGILHFDQIFLAVYTTIGEEYTRAAQRLTGGDFNWYNYYLWHLFDHNLWTDYLPQSPLSKMDNVVESGFLHEHFYVFSLFLIPALFLAWPKHKLLLGSYLFAFCLAIILAGGVVLPGFADSNWINQVPLWHYFRCPARTLILLSILSYFLGIYFLLDISKNKTFKFHWITQIIIFAVLLAVFYLPLDLVNLYAILGLVAFLAAIILRYFPPKVFKILPPSLRCLLGPEFFSLLSLAITAICHVTTLKGGAYIAPTNWPTYTAVRQTVDAELLPQITPGQKVVFDTRQFSLGSNNEIIYNLETIHGYSTPLRRFSYLWAAHINNPAMQNFVQLNPAEPDMSFRMLYQGGRLVSVKDNQWQIAPWPKLAPVRSPRHIHLFSTLAEIATWQKANYHFSDPFFWQQNTSILHQDLQQHALTFLPKTVLKTCTAQLNKLGPTFTHGSQLQIVLEPTSTFPCLLVLPYNYSKFLTADNPTVAIFPVDYALIGIYLHQAPPQNQFTILTKFDFRQYIFVKVGIWFILLLIGSGYYLFSARNFLAKKNSFF